MHLIVTFYASPKKIAMIEKSVNCDFKYPVEGKARKGYARPFLSRGPFGTHDVRCERQVAPLVLRDLNAQFTGRPVWFTKKSFHGDLDMKDTARMTKFLHTGIWLFRLLSPLKDCKAAGGLPMFREELPGWFYCYFLGAHADAVNPQGREIL